MKFTINLAVVLIMMLALSLPARLLAGKLAVHGELALRYDTVPIQINHFRLFYDSLFIPCERYSINQYDPSKVVSESSVDRYGSHRFFFEASKGEVYHLAFKNENEVYLNSGSSLSFISDAASFFYIPIGEATFHINRYSVIYLNDSLYLWVVPGSVVNVRNYRDYSFEHPTATLLTGSAEIVRLKGSTPMERLIDYSEVDHRLVTSTADSLDCSSWNNFSFKYKDIGIYALASRIGRWYGYNVIFNGPLPANFSFNAKFSDPLEVVLEKLNKKKMSCAIVDGKILIDTGKF